ncbi:MAG: phospholipase A, partial [Flavobacterium sp.]
MYLKYLFICCILFSINANSQLLENEKNVHAADLLLKESSFSIHKDNYFLTGVPLNDDITRNTADVKYQVSFKERLSSKPFLGGFFLYLMYTQKAFWDIYASSKP